MGADPPVRGGRWLALALATVALAGSCAAGGEGTNETGSASSNPLPRVLLSAADTLEVDPSRVGMDSATLERLDSVLLRSLEGGAAPGAALAIGRHGRLVRLRGYGVLGLDSSPGTAVTANTLYDLASLTKVVGTTTAVAILEQDGRIALDRTVASYLPWWTGGHPEKERVTVRQLLVHRAGLPAFRPWFREMEGDAAYREALAAEPLEWAPGTRTAYSDLGAMTLGFLVAEVSGMPLDRFLEERVWRPLGMDDTGFRPDSTVLARTAPTELDTLWRGRHVHGTVHDENADAAGGVAGHAGLFSTARDLSVFAQMMLGRGSVSGCGPVGSTVYPCAPGRDSVRILDPGTVEGYTRRHDPEESRALGWDTPSGQSSAGDFISERAFGHTGFTGTSIWIDPELDLFVVLLTNRISPTRANQRHVPLRREVHDLAATAIVDRPVLPRPGALR